MHQDSGSAYAGIWILKLLAGIAGVAAGLFPFHSVAFGRDQRKALLFSGTVLASAVVVQLVFLLVLSYSPHPWYYVGFVGVLGCSLDLVAEVLSQGRRLRWCRLSLALVLGLAALPALASQTRLRQTNNDWLAEKLTQWAAPNDLIVVSAWYLGISFERYYRGSTPWVTVPPIDFHKFHRFDLVKAQMLLPDPNQSVRPVEEAIARTLKRGGRVWITGVRVWPSPDQSLPVLVTAPNKTYGWSDKYYTVIWSAKVAAYLQGCAEHNEEVECPVAQDTLGLERVPLRVFSGWSGPGLEPARAD
jgi:hypothetical protein